MKTYNNPQRKEWTNLVQRVSIKSEELTKVVQSIIQNVKANGDKALTEYANQFDNVGISDFLVTRIEIEEAKKSISQELKEAIDIAYKNIYTFHKAQKDEENKIETSEGITCWRKSSPIEKVGLYIPGGSAPLFSTILMLGIPSKIAGCEEISMCTPSDKNKEVHPAILYTADLVGITKIYKVGGAQAIAAMAYGTESVNRVYKIFGPGNQYVTKAKELIQQDGIAIDMPAGPSELLIIADESSKPSFVAADLLSQAEHGADSQVILLSDNSEVIDQVLVEIEIQIESLPRKEIALKALQNSKSILLNTIDECFEFSNEYAPEHLIIASENANNYLNKIKNAGSVFIGNYSCEAAGDYASGTNHTLPTNGFAKNYSGVSLDSFVKKITFQEVTKKGIQNIGKAIEIMAETEGLIAHKNAVSIRLKDINND